MGLLDIIIIFLIIAWLGGFSIGLGGNIIHTLLVIAVIMLIARLLGFKI